VETLALNARLDSIETLSTIFAWLALKAANFQSCQMTELELVKLMQTLAQFRVVKFAQEMFVQNVVQDCSEIFHNQNA